MASSCKCGVKGAKRIVGGEIAQVTAEWDKSPALGKMNQEILEKKLIFTLAVF